MEYVLKESIPYGPLVKGLRHRLFTAVTRVRIPYGLYFYHALISSDAELCRRFESYFILKTR